MLPLLSILSAVLSGCVDPTGNGRRPEDSDAPDDTGHIDTDTDDTSKPDDTYTDDTGDDTGTPPDPCEGFSKLWFNPEPFVIEGEDEYDAYDGLSVTAGDVDGDGINDLILGFESAGTSTYYPGKVYVLRGGNNIFAGGVISAGDVPIQWAGNESGQSFGASLAATDLDGNGQADLLITEQTGLNVWYNPLGTDQAEGFIVGAGNPRIIPDIDEATTDDEGNIIPGPGELVVGGNGAFDIIPLENIASSGTQNIDDIRRYEVGSEIDYYSSIDTVAAGDMDGDGLAEVAFGDSDDFYYGVGKVYLVKGKEGGWDSSFVDVGTKTGADIFTLTGTSIVNSVGATLGSGDVDGDKLADLFVGAPGETNGHENSGGLHKISSQGITPSRYGTTMEVGVGIDGDGTLTLPESAAVYGNEDNTYLPNSIAVINDTECGLSAVVGSTDEYDRAFVVDALTLANLKGANEDTVDKADQTLGYGETAGVEEGSEFGKGVYAIGDVGCSDPDSADCVDINGDGIGDADGIPDLAVTAPAGPNGTMTGQVFVFLGERGTDQ